MNRLLRILTLSVACSALIYGGACGGDETTATSSTGGDEIDVSDVIFSADANNDEALQTMLAATPKVDAAQGAVFDSPGDGAELAASAIPTFAWHVGAPTGSLPAPRAPGGAFAVLLDLVGGERSAHAHGPEINGKAYFLVFSTPTDPKLVRFFTLGTSYTPDAAAWEKMKAAGVAITATITTAAYDKNLIPADGGPFAGTPISFTVK